MAETSRVREIVETAFSTKIVKRSLKVSAIVGTILMVINHGDAIISGAINADRLAKIILTYCVPYLVSTYSAVSATLECNKKLSE